MGNYYALANKVRRDRAELVKLLEWHQEQVRELDGEDGQESALAFHQWAKDLLTKVTE